MAQYLPVSRSWPVRGTPASQCFTFAGTFGAILIKPLGGLAEGARQVANEAAVHYGRQWLKLPTDDGASQQPDRPSPAEPTAQLREVLRESRLRGWELRVLAGMVENRRDEDIAGELGISVYRVQTGV